MDGRRVIVIGVDGATFRVIDPLVREGRLPNIARMMDGGVRGVLNSTVPAVSPVAWTSFMTGMNPDRHLIFDFSGRVRGTYGFRINTARERKARPFWMSLSEHGRKVFVAGVTMTYPPDPVNGYMISGLGAPTDSAPGSCFFPPALAAEVEKEMGKYRTTPEGDMRRLYRSDREKERYLKGVLEQIDYRVRLFKYMWRKGPFDFSMIFFLDTDGASHYFWKHMDAGHSQYMSGSPFGGAIPDVYEAVDKAIGEILEFAGAGTDVVVVSDHGFGPLNRVVFLNNWLSSGGYLKFKDSAGGGSFLSSIISRARGIKGAARRDVDWGNTKAFFNGTVGNIFVNLKGRDPEGTVDPGEYDGVLRAIQAGLEDLTDHATGTKVVDRVYRRDESRGAAGAWSAPDLVVTFKSGYSVVGEEIMLHGLKDTGEIIADSRNWSGTHEPDGVFIGSGGAFKKGRSVEGAAIIDVAPTLLHLLGVPVPDGMDGVVLMGAFDEGYIRGNPVSYAPDAQGPAAGGEGEGFEDKEVLERLKGLGYIE
jgi:predicted AlkP superfamily phosphohydrolase/phosphomutase